MALTVLSSLKLTPFTTFSWKASLPPGSPNTLSRKHGWTLHEPIYCSRRKTFRQGPSWIISPQPFEETRPLYGHEVCVSRVELSTKTHTDKNPKEKGHVNAQNRGAAKEGHIALPLQQAPLWKTRCRYAHKLRRPLLTFSAGGGDENLSNRTYVRVHVFAYSAGTLVRHCT